MDADEEKERQSRYELRNNQRVGYHQSEVSGGGKSGGGIRCAISGIPADSSGEIDWLSTAGRVFPRSMFQVFFFGEKLFYLFYWFFPFDWIPFPSLSSRRS